MEDEGLVIYKDLSYKIVGILFGVYNEPGPGYREVHYERAVAKELKQGDYFSRKNFHQVNEYLKASGLKLAILANFTTHGVTFKRILNINK